MPRWLLFLLPWALSCQVFSSEPSCNIRFPTLNSSVITAEEGATVVLPVTAPAGCRDLLAVRISMKMSDSHSFVCNALLHNDRCYKDFRLDKWPLCQCVPGEFRFQLNITVDRSHNGAYLEMALVDKVNKQSEVKLSGTFNVTYPAKITSLVLEKHQLSEGLEVNSSLQVVCLWDKGNPPVAARLLDRHGVEMEGSIYSSGQIRYTFPAVGCQDAGLIRCEAPGASHNETVTLKVKSTPEMSTNYKTPIIIEPGKSLDQELEVCAHTSDLKSCLMTQLTGTSRDRPGREISRTLPLVNENTKSSSFCNLIGTPPDLSLTVRLDNVRKEEEGQWALTLTNDVGSGRVDFMILIKRAPEFQNSINMTAAAGEDIELKFPVKSHTTHITNCQLVRCGSGEQSFWTRAAGLGLNCLSFVTLTGTPPDLVLTVRLDNVKKQDQGQWRLELTNEAGVGHMNFSLHIELEVSAEHQMPTLTIVATTVPSMLCLVLIIVITTICIKRANRGSKTNVTVRDESIALERRDDRANRTVSTVSQASVNDYHEIPDDIPDEVGESASDGYLVPSPVENTAYGLEPAETTPIYQNELPLEPEQEGIAAAAAADLPPGDVQNPAASRADVEGADNVTTG